MIKIEKYLFYALIFFLPWQTRIILKSWSEPFSEWNSASLHLTDIILLAVIFLWVWRVFRKGNNAPHPPLTLRGGEIALIAFLAIGALSLFKAQNFWLGFYKEIKLIGMAVLFLYVKNNYFGNNAPHPPLNLRGGEGGVIIRIFQTLVVSGLFQALIAIGQFIRQKSFGLSFLDESPISPALAGVAKIVVDGEKFIRPYGLASHPNILAAFLLIAIFCALYLFTEKNKNFQWRSAIGYAAILAILVFAFFLTFSRTIITVGLVAIFGWLIWLFFCHSGLEPESRLGSLLSQGRRLDSRFRSPRWSFGEAGGNDTKKVFRRKWYFLNTIAVFTACCLLVIILFWPFLSARFDVGVSLADQALNLRVFYNKVALQLIGQNPFLGVGIGNFVSAFQASQTLSEPWMYQPAHNIYLLIASEIGIIGLLVFLALLFFVVKNAWRILHDPEKSYWLFAICALLLIGFFDHFFWTLQQGQLMFWVLLGIMASSTTKEYWTSRTL